MSDDAPTSILSTLSDALAALVIATSPAVAAIEVTRGRYLSALRWQADALVTSEQALPKGETFPVLLHEQETGVARLAGRDSGTNVAVLRLETPRGAAPVGRASAEPKPGGLAVALGAQPGVQARLAMIRAVGPAWQSMTGGQIDRLIRLDMRASHAEEGGPVLDAAGALIGMATAGPRSRALIIPHQTIARVFGPLLESGRTARGWLGVGLQPVSIPPALREQASGDTGLMVAEVAPGGPAEQAGVLPGDIVLSLDGKAVTRSRGLASALGGTAPGRTVALGLLRAGQRIVIEAVVGTHPGR